VIEYSGKRMHESSMKLLTCGSIVLNALPCTGGEQKQEWPEQGLQAFSTTGLGKENTNTTA